MYQEMPDHKQCCHGEVIFIIILLLQFIRTTNSLNIFGSDRLGTNKNMRSLYSGC